MVKSVIAKSTIALPILALSIAALFLAAPGAAFAADPAPAAGAVYVVKPGDTLEALAAHWLGGAEKAAAIKEATLAAAGTGLEGLADAKGLEALAAGQKLILPVPLTVRDPKEYLVDSELNFPEAPFWSSRDGALYYVEWGGDKIWKLKDGKKELFLETRPSDGPCGMDQDAAGNLWVAMYTSGHMVLLSPEGEELKRFGQGPKGRFVGPNDLVIDSAGGVYFTDSGDFDEDWTTGREAGKLYYLSPKDEITLLDEAISYANGVVLSPDGKTLYVNEHRKNRILSYPVAGPGQIGQREIFAELDSDCLSAEDVCYEVGPDGMTRDADGNLWVAHYHSGALLKITPKGELAQKLFLPQGDTPTNASLTPDGQALYVSEASQGLLLKLPLK
jgi:sugar lactone lactonase YvrE